MSETEQVNDLRLRLFGEFPDARLFRNNNGRLKDIYGNYVTYGLGKGTSDTIGFKPVVVTPELLGARLAVFCAIEVKNARGRATDAQRDFIELVNRSGGLAGIARSFDEAREILNRI
jgi:hypothetical protein